MQALTTTSTISPLLRRFFFQGGTLHYARAYAICPAGLKSLLRLVVVVVVFLGVGLLVPASAQQTSETFNNSGTFTVPQGVTEITVEVWGGGGGGVEGNAGGGGGGGAYARSILSVVAGQQFAITIGSGGSPGNGGASWFGSGPLVRAPGGNTGSGNSGGAGGAHTTAIGDFSFSGGTGGTGLGSGNAHARGGGGGGGSAFYNENGSKGGDGGNNAPGSGGNGTGKGGSGGLNQTPGENGIAPGGGGGGGTNNSNPGSGANGRVVVSYTQDSEVVLRLQYFNANTETSSQSLRPHIRLFNDGTDYVLFTDITIRYYFTSEPPGDDMLIVDWARVGNANVTGQFVDGIGHRYLEVAFTSSAAVPAWYGGDGTPNILGPGVDTDDIRLRIRDSGWGHYNQSDDYSWDPAYTSFADFENITVYHKGELVWGTPPTPAHGGDKLSFGQQPTAASAGQAIDPPVTVRIEHNDGTLVSDASGPVTLTLGNNPDGASLGGITIVNAVNGIATFPDLRVSQAGSGFTLAANSPGMTLATSQAFNITERETISLRLQYLANNTNASSQTISPYMVLYNDDIINVLLSDITIRYWFTSEPPGNDVAVIDWAAVNEDHVTGTFGTSGSEPYLEIGFTGNAQVPGHLGGNGTNYLLAGGQTGAMHVRIHDSSWGTYDQSNDYSFDPSFTEYANHPYITVYYQGQLVWGLLPTSGRSVSGIILDSGGNPVNGVTLTATDGHSATVATNSSGVYLFTGINPGNRTITITPQLAGYSFDPTQQTITNHFGDNPVVTGINFTAISVSGPFYSRQTGNWNQATTWSRENHGGPAAASPPGPTDQVFIASGHSVSLAGNVTNNASITLNNQGTLVTGSHIISGSGSFNLNSGGTLHIGHSSGLLASGTGGNIQTASRSYSQEAHYVYDGTLAQNTGSGLPESVSLLTVNNPLGVTALKGQEVSGTLNLQNGLFTMPVGTSLVANSVNRTGGNLRMQTRIEGAKGWRLISSPVQTTYEDLLGGGFVSQGFPGSNFPSLQPNLLWFDETEIGTTNEAWRTLTQLGTPTAGGRGYFFYVFNGAGMNAGGQYSDQLPIDMSAMGLEHATGGSAFDFGITHTPRSTGVSDQGSEIMELNAGWNLIGNPSTASLDWAGLHQSGVTGGSLSTAMYTWDHVSGNYLAWNGQVGSTGNLIAPFQAFWVYAESPGTALQMTDQVKTLDGQFRQKSLTAKADSDYPVLELALLNDNLAAFTFLSFMPDGQFGEDPWDAYRLEPLSETFLKLYTTSSMHNKPLLINNMPHELNEPIQVPLYVGGQQEGIPVTGSYTLNWYNSGMWPEHWTVTLMDHQMEKAISMKRYDTYEFNVTGAGKSSQAVNNTAGVRSVAGKNTAVGKSTAGSGASPDQTGGPQQFRLPQNIIAIHDPAAGLDPVAKASKATPRFTIVIKPHSTEEEEPEYIPNEARMMPPYPNPFDHQTTIRFSLPKAAHVTVEIFDIQGRRVALLADQHFESGTTTLPWSPNRLSGGIYIAVMRTEGRVETQKISLIR